MILFYPFYDINKKYTVFFYFYKIKYSYLIHLIFKKIVFDIDQPIYVDILTCVY